MPDDKPYHHGDLRRALLDAALEQTRRGGPTALALREATRRIGVSPSAAYRHFSDRDDLQRAVSVEVQQRMADRMREHPLARRDGGSRPGDPLRAVGLGYIGFALEEPGWFEVAFDSPGPTPTGPIPERAEMAPPFALLVAALDELVRTGQLGPGARDDAEWPCWSAVHGFSLLALHGPLRHQDAATVHRAAERTVDAAVAGVLATG